MAEPRTMVDIVGAKTCPDELLEQIGFFVRTLGRAKTCERLRALLVSNLDETLCGDVERLFPRRFAEVGIGICWIDLVVGVLFDTRQPHQRLCQAVRVVDVVEPKSSF